MPEPRHQTGTEPHLRTPAARDTPSPDDTPGTEALPSRPVADGPEFAAGTLLADRYAVEERVAEGGMGMVLRVFDRKLKRELAVKVMKPRMAREPEMVSRFLAEAEVCGRLQHPGVVPLHEIDALPDGTPFFTMKLVRGRTLHELLAGRPSPAAELPRLVHVFEQVCQAVAYAHSQGFIHRDLKPLNVMVGAFGEVQVMDWGLAKAVGDRPAPEAVPAPAAPAEGDGSIATVGYRTSDAGEPVASGAGLTEAGRVLGTLAYMPPEQATGDVARIDRRSDVFALGAILCEVLTGQPPYVGARTALWEQARAGVLGPALDRLRNCGADAELVALANHCLRPDPAERPADAAAMARLVGEYRATVEARLRHAQEEQVAANARARAERRARRITLALAGAVLLLVLGGGGVLWWAQQQRTEARGRQQGADNGARQAMGDAERLHGEARDNPLKEAGKFREAQAVAAKALGLAEQGGSDAVRDQARELLRRVEADVAQADRNRQLLAALLEMQMPHETSEYELDESGRMVEVSERNMDAKYAAIFRRWGLDVDATPFEEVVARLQEQPQAIVQELVTGLDEWAGWREGPSWERLADLADRLDDSKLRKQLRRIRFSPDLYRDRLLGELTNVLLPWPGLPGVDIGKTRRRLRSLADKVDPATEPVLALLALHNTLRDAGDESTAERLLREALTERPDEVVLHSALARQMAEQQPPRWNEVILHFEAARSARPELGVALGRMLLDAKRPDQAERLFRTLSKRQPDNPDLHFYRGIALHDLKKLAESEAAYRKGLALNPDQVWVFINLGNVLGDLKRPEEAEAAYRKALALQPDHPDPLACNNLGNLLRKQGRLEEAEALHRKAVALQPASATAHNHFGLTLLDRKKLAEAEEVFRTAIALKPNYAAPYTNLANVLIDQQRFGEVEAASRKAIALQPSSAAAHNNLGLALFNLGKFAESEAICRRAVELKPDYPEALLNLGNALLAQKRYADAEAAYRKALALRPHYTPAQENLGAALRGQKRYAEAEEAFRKGVELEPDSPRAHNNLGHALRNLKKYAEAEAAHRKAIALQPDFVHAYHDLGRVLSDQKRYAEAATAYRKVVDLEPNNAEGYFDLGTALQADKKLTEAETAYRKAVTLQPRYAKAQLSLGNLLKDQQRYADAEAAYRAVIAAEPGNALAHYNLGRVLHEQKKLAEAEAAFRAAIALEPERFSAHNNLGNVLRDRKQYADAEAAYRKAIALKPDDAPAHNGLGQALYEQKKLVEAEAAYRKAVELDPSVTKGYFNLGQVLRDLKKFAEAEAAYREAVALEPADGGTLNNLANVLRDRGKLAEALAAYRRAAELSPEGTIIRGNVQKTQRLVEVDRMLTAIRAGKEQPGSAAVQIELAELCARYRDQPAAAVGFYRGAFRADPKLQNVSQGQNRYHAACAAIRALSGQGQDTSGLGAEDAMWLSQQARAWLRAEVSAYQRSIEKGDASVFKQVRQRLQPWQQDTDLAVVREEASLAGFPAAERAAWQQLWTDADALLKKLGTGKE